MPLGFKQTITIDTNFNPYEAPTDVSALEVKYLRDRHLKTTFWTRVLAILFCATILVAIGIMASKIESIIGSGPVLILIAIIFNVNAVRCRNYLAILVSATAPLFCLFIFGSIYFLDWSPSEAETPVQLMTWGYAAIVIPPALWVAIRRGFPKTEAPKTTAL